MSIPSSLESIFFAALEKGSPQERLEYLDAACAGDPDLLGRVRSLLEAQAKAGSFLEQPAYVPELVASRDAFDDRPGKMIGAYKLLEQVGEGGMGTVWRAQQLQPVQRLVALKLIKAGMDSKQVSARFEAERQALALMDHPNIARVLDAGTEEGGRPYFVMDLVEGVPITTYCDEHRLTPRDRLELFIPVCQAIQHAHQKGIIHRDIKPTNVLVAVHDGKPVPKVIDFGVAKATEQRFGDRTLFTQYGILVGTLEYMSPEQAEASAQGLDTRSDIYSLGVLLYELLTGSTPLTRLRIQGAAFGEIVRIIREEDPPTPSMRLGGSGEARAPISARRHLEPAKLTKLVRGELDWIVMKALEKDRNRRYESSSGFAADVQRYLTHEPVLAGPPSAAYRLRKFVRRNRGALFAGGMLASACLVAIGGVGWAVRDRSARQADIERDRTERVARVSATVRQILAEADRSMAEHAWPEALAAARRAAVLVKDSEADRETAQRTRELLKDLEFVDRLDRIRQVIEVTGPSAGKARSAFVSTEYRRAFQDFGVDVERLEVESSTVRLGARPALALPIAAALDHWYLVRADIGADMDSARKLVAVSRGIDPEPLRDRVRKTWLGPITADEQAELVRLTASIEIRAQDPTTLIYLARALSRAGRTESALQLLRDAQLAFPGDFWLNFTLSLNLYNRKDYEGALRYSTAAASVRPDLATAFNTAGNALCGLNRADAAIAVYHKALEIRPRDAMAQANLANALQRQKKLDEALVECRKAVEFDPTYALGHYVLAGILVELERLDEAVAAYRQCIELDPQFALAHASLGQVMNMQKQPEEALACLHKALELDPNCASAHYYLGIALADLQKLDEAIASYRKAIAIEPRHARAYLGLGRALRRRNDAEGALAAFRKTIEIDPAISSAYLGIASALYACRDFEGAIPAYQKAIEFEPRNADLYLVLGSSFEYQHRPDEAVAAYRKGVELDPLNAQRHLILGSCLYGLERFDEALECYRRTVQLDPRSSLAYGVMGDVLFLQKRMPEAEASFRKAVEIDPQYDRAYVGLGRALRTQGKLAEAIAAFEEGIRLQPKSAEDAITLARILATCPDPQLRNAARAVELAENAVALDPTQRRYLNTLGVAHYRAAHWKEASAAFERSMELQNGGDSFDWYFVAMIQFQLGETQSAHEWYARAVEWKDRVRPASEELRAFQAEAARLLGIEPGKD